MTEAFGRIIVPVDGSEIANKAAGKALALAQLADIKVIAMHVINVDLSIYDYPKEIQLLDLLQKEGHSILAEIVMLGEEMAITVSKKLVEGHPAEEIIKEAKEDDLIVMGSKGRTGLDRLLLGSVAENVARHASCPVMIVK
jgi:nucleotide-binding universal stress UspA family protein